MFGLNDLFIAKQGDEFKVIAFSVITGGGFVFNGIKNLRKKQKIQDTPTSKISTAAQGLTEIQGYAWPVIHQTAANGKTVAFHGILIEEYRSSGKNSRWETVFKQESSAPFLVVDNTGVCEILPIKADIDTSSRCCKLKELTETQKLNLIKMYPEAAQYLGHTKGGFISMLLDKPIRITEKAIFVGSPVFAQGYFQTSHNLQSHALEGLSSFALQLKENFQTTHLAKAKEKTINKKNWAYQANELLKTEQTTTIEISGELHANSEHGLMVADCHQNEFLNKMGYKPYLFLLGGLLLLSGGLFYLLQQLHLAS